MTQTDAGTGDFIPLSGRTRRRGGDARGNENAGLGGWYERDVLSTTTPAGDRVLLHLPTGTYLGLDRAASRIVGLLEEEDDVDAAATALARQFDIAPEKARADVVSVLTSIRRLSATRRGRGRRPTVAGSRTELRRWIKLPARRRRMAAEAFIVVLLIEVGLRLVDVDRLARRLGVPLASDEGSATTLASPGSAISDLDGLEERERLAYWAVSWVLARWTHDATCLRQALAFGWFVRHRHPVLRIGLLDGDDLVAHAWVEADGALYNALPVTGSFAAGRLSAPAPTGSVGITTGTGHGL